MPERRRPGAPPRRDAAGGRRGGAHRGRRGAADGGGTGAGRCAKRRQSGARDRGCAPRRGPSLDGAPRRRARRRTAARACHAVCTTSGRRHALPVCGGAGQLPAPDAGGGPPRADSTARNGASGGVRARTDARPLGGRGDRRRHGFGRHCAGLGAGRHVRACARHRRVGRRAGGGAAQRGGAGAGGPDTGGIPAGIAARAGGGRAGAGNRRRIRPTLHSRKPRRCRHRCATGNR